MHEIIVNLIFLNNPYLLLLFRKNGGNLEIVHENIISDIKLTKVT